MDNWISFYVELEWSKEMIYNSFKEKLLKYNVGQYIVGKEVAENTHKETNGEHIHVCCQMSNEEYHKFAVTVLRQQMKLRGRAIAGFCRQYGKVKQVRSLEKMKAYTIKDDNIDTNIDENELNKLKEISYKKINTVTEFWKIVDYVNDKMGGDIDEYGYDARRYVIEYMIKNQEDVTKTPSKPMIDNVVKSYVMYKANITDDQRINWITNFLYG